MTILMKNLKDVKKVFVSITTVFLLILLVLIICTCSGQKLMLGTQSLEKPTEFSLSSGRHVSWIPGHMDCAISRIGDPDFHLWLRQNWYIRQQYQAIHGMGYFQRLELMQRKCLQTKLYQYLSTTHFSLSPFRTVWIAPKPNWHTGYRPQNLQGERLIRTNVPRNSLGSTPRSTGRPPVITRTTGRNSNYSPMMNRANGRDRTTSSTTGGSRRRH